MCACETKRKQETENTHTVPCVFRKFTRNITSYHRWASIGSSSSGDVQAWIDPWTGQWAVHLWVVTHHRERSPIWWSNRQRGTQCRCCWKGAEKMLKSLHKHTFRWCTVHADILTQRFHAGGLARYWPEPRGVTGPRGRSIIAWGGGVGLQTWGGGLVVLRDEGTEMELTAVKLHTTSAQIHRAPSR